MALVLQDRVKETTTTTGTGTFTLNGTSTGFVPFSVIGNGNETYYTAVDNTTGEWEVGIGTYNVSTLTRDTVLASSNSGNKVPFAAGSKDVFVAYPAEKAVTLDTPQTLTGKTLVSADLGTPLAAILTNATGLPLSTGVTGTLPVGNGGTGATSLTGYVKASGTAAFAAVATIPGSDVSGNISGNAANVTGVVAVANGGTAVTSAPANGQLLIGNGTGYTLATLTAGTGVSITNGAGTITINAPEVGTVTAVTATAPLASSGGNTPDISLTGTVGVNNGGTGATTLTGYVKASGTAAFTAVAQIPNTDISGLGTMSTQNANNVAITGGAINGTTVGATTPGSGAFTTLVAAGASITSINSGVALLTTATVTNLTATGASIASANIGNLQFTGASAASMNIGTAVITNLTVTSASIASQNGAVANISTVTAATKVVTPFVDAVGSGGGQLRNASGTSQLLWGAGGGNNLSLEVPTNINPTNGNVSIAPTGTGTVTINPATAGTMNNVAIGGTTAAAGTFTSATVSTGNLTFSSTGQRITGDFSNATRSNRLSFQTSTTNGGTRIQYLPNGPGTFSQQFLYNSSDIDNSGYLLLACASGESLIDSNRTGTGTYLPMTFYTGGSERMRLDTSGNLGLAVAPSAWGGSFKAFQISSSSIYNNNTNDTFIGANFFWDGTNNKYISTDFAVAYGQQDGEHRFYTAPSGTAGNNVTFTERMRIDSSGNVGIGTASPTFKLVAANSGTDGGWIYSTGAVSVLGLGGYANSGDGAFQIRYDRATGGITLNGGTRDTPAARVTIDNSGNVGIGTASAGFNSAGLPLIVGSGSGNTGMTIFSGNASSGSIHFGDTVSTGADSYRGFLNYTHSTNSMQFGTDATERMRITSGGKVGIGTTAPTYLLEVTATGNARTNMPARFGNAVGNLDIGGSDGTYVYIDTNSWGLGLRTGTGTGQAYFTTAGEFIIGQTDQGAYNLQCNGTGVWGAGAYVNGSDARLKDNIQSLDSGLDVVKAIRPVTFQYKPEYSKDQSVQPGFIAQELQTAMAGKAYLEGVVQEGPNHLNVAYQNIIPILVKAMQEQQDQIKALQDKIAALEAK